MKLYSLYTNHHKVFKDDWFIPSLKEEFDLNIKEYQHDTKGEIGNKAFKKAMLLKVSTIIDAVQENVKDTIIYSDIDIQFFKSFKKLVRKEIENYDILIQRDSPFGVFCAGFMVIKCNENTLYLFKKIKEIMVERDTHDDQQILNELLFYNLIECNFSIRIQAFIIRRLNLLKNLILNKENDSYKLFTKFKNPFHLKVNHLPDSFFSGGTLSARLWKPNDHLTIPDDIILHHANWTVGIENKIEQLNYVKQVVQSRKLN